MRLQMLSPNLLLPRDGAGLLLRLNVWKVSGMPKFINVIEEERLWFPFGFASFDLSRDRIASASSLTASHERDLYTSSFVCRVLNVELSYHRL